MRVCFMKLHCYASRGLLVAAILLLAVCDQRKHGRRNHKPLGVEHSPAKKLTIEGVRNFGEVTPMLYRGGQPSSEGFEALAKMGVKIVVDGRLSGHDNERKEVEKRRNAVCVHSLALSFSEG